MAGSTGMEPNPWLTYLVPSLAWEQQAEGAETFICCETE